MSRLWDNIETSDTKPITVSWIIRGSEALSSGGGGHAPQQPHAQVTVVSGALGLCYCPGKQHSRGGRRIARSLDTDLSRLREHHKVDCLVCLLNDAELRVRPGGWSDRHGKRIGGLVMKHQALTEARRVGRGTPGTDRVRIPGHCMMHRSLQLPDPGVPV